jgi:MFS family permease
MSPPVPRLSASEQAAPAWRLRLVPVLGGVLVDSIGWRSIFSINLPIGALGIWLTAQYARETSRSEAMSYDFPAQAPCNCNARRVCGPPQ